MKQNKLKLTTKVAINKRDGSILAAYFHIREGKSVQIKEFAKGNAFADYDRHGNLLGIELLAPCEISVLTKIARKEPEPIKRFLRGSIPRDLERRELVGTN